MAIKLVILGRDGILNAYRDDHVKAPAEWQTMPGAFEALARLHQAGWHLVVATNQAGIGRGMIDMASINAVHAHMNSLAQTEGARFDAVFFCPHTPEEACDCRKPKPGLLLDIGRRFGVDLSTVPVVGDTVRDLQAAQAAGCQPHLIRCGRSAALTPEQLAQICEQIPGTRVHASLQAFAEHLLARAAVPHSGLGGLSA
jgi:D-glycero-D-manno-heptose 1,7-bisphosphate phosphatase